MGFGAQKKNNIIKKMLSDYRHRSFYKKENKIDLTTSPKINTESLLKCNIELIRDGSTQICNNMIFCNRDGYKNKLIHHGDASWMENKDEKLKNKVYHDTYIKRNLRNPKLSNFIEKNTSRKIFDMYVFFSYDILENGILYFVKRKINSLGRNK